MSIIWEKHYKNFVINPKVQMLSESDQRRFMMIVFIHLGGNHGLIRDSQIAFILRISVDEFLCTKERLTDAGLIDQKGRIAIRGEV